MLERRSCYDHCCRFVAGLLASGVALPDGRRGRRASRYRNKYCCVDRRLHRPEPRTLLQQAFGWAALLLSRHKTQKEATWSNHSSRVPRCKGTPPTEITARGITSSTHRKTQGETRETRITHKHSRYVPRPRWRRSSGHVSPWGGSWRSSRCSSPET